MSQGYLPIAPDLELHITWSSRMSEALCKRYGQVVYLDFETGTGLQPGYDRWCQAKAAAYTQVQRLLRLTASLPVVGDHLMQGGFGREILRIDKRLFYTTDDSEPVLLVYEVSSEELEDWEHNLSQRQELEEEEAQP